MIRGAAGKAMCGAGAGMGTSMMRALSTRAAGVSSKFPRKVKIVEVGPRDGLQNEAQFVDTDVKVELINRLAATGLPAVEATAFVSPKWVPQMADAAEVLSGLTRVPGVAYPVLTPNVKGLERAVEAGAEEVAVFAAASEAFSQRNINCSVAESLERFAPVLDAAAVHGVRVRGYVSTVMGCPYDGAVAPSAVAYVARELVGMGCYEVSLGDTIGVGNVATTHAMLDAVLEDVAAERVAMHFHDTYGQALPNLLVGLEKGVGVIDSSVAQLGGCPYAKGATGNVATEDVVYMLQGLEGVDVGVDLDALVDVGEWISGVLGRPNGSSAARAIANKRGE